MRTVPLRAQMGQELNEVLKHLEEFVRKYQESAAQRTPRIDEHLWTRQGAVSTYGLLLVAHPLKAQGGIGQYVTRAQNRFNENVTRLYVLGAGNENRFAEQVITAIKNQTGYTLVERFELYKDYRGEPGGVGAVFEKK